MDRNADDTDDADLRGSARVSNPANLRLMMYRGHDTDVAPLWGGGRWVAFATDVAPLWGRGRWVAFTTDVAPLWGGGRWVAFATDVAPLWGGGRWGAFATDVAPLWGGGPMGHFCQRRCMPDMTGLECHAAHHFFIAEALFIP